LSFLNTASIHYRLVGVCTLYVVYCEVSIPLNWISLANTTCFHSRCREKNQSEQDFPFRLDRDKRAQSTGAVFSRELNN
jgi:hypothetical protein